ncbi:hypothetical protein GRF29_216g444211 [Pseudopithomyces chartarum]|uniref:Uncharacterized protein n=1 Tax=Pseudopithomyces chartarum TaxID=1892770 RepID=A0AAN6LLN1_9PLEO|nr:hypothetical protein GRF29_216g444211 [Pseudopithomyces chartarum]
MELEELEERSPPHEDPPGPTWKALPTEIKLYILRKRLLISKPITFKTHPSHSRRCLLPLMLTDKETKDLSRQIYYGENTFILSNDPRNYMRYDKFLRTPHPAHRPWVCKLELRIHDRDDRSHQFSCVESGTDPMHDLAWPLQLKPSFLLYNLFEPRDEAVREVKNRGYCCEVHGQGDIKWTCGRTVHSAEWQNHFDDVRDLKIVMIGTPCFTGQNGMLPGNQTPEQVVSRLSSQIRISMGTRKLELVMEEGDGWHFNKYCKGLCTGILQSLVKGLVEIRTAKD